MADEMKNELKDAGGGCAGVACSPLPEDHPLTLYPLSKEDMDKMEQDVRDGKATPYLQTYALCRHLLCKEKAPVDAPKQCRKCWGDGQVEIQSGPYYRECPECRGSGLDKENAQTQAPNPYKES